MAGGDADMEVLEGMSRLRIMSGAASRASDAPPAGANGVHSSLRSDDGIPAPRHAPRGHHRHRHRHRHRRKRSPVRATPASSTTTAQLKFEARIGVGSRGQVFRAVTQEGKAVAVKVMNREDEESSIEVRALLRLQPHPHIVCVEGEVEYSSENVFLILEFAETDLLEAIMSSHAASQRGLPEEDCVRYFYQLAKALRHCHRNSVYHLDVKPENCLLRAGVLKLCDFGSSSLRRTTDKASGSVYYAAPEVLPLFYQHSSSTPLVPGAHRISFGNESPLVEGMSHHSYDAAAADVWSLGVVLFVMLAGRPPWSEASFYDTEFVALSNGAFTFPPHFSPPAVKLLRSMLQIRSRARPSVADILRDPWVTPFTGAKQEVNALEKSMRKHLRFLDAPARDADDVRLHSSSRLVGDASVRSGGMSTREEAGAATALSSSNLLNSSGDEASSSSAALTPGVQAKERLAQLRSAGAAQQQALHMAHLSPQSPYPQLAQTHADAARNDANAAAAGHDTPEQRSFPIESQRIIPLVSAVASPPPSLGGGLKISIAATRRAHDDAMDVDVDTRHSMSRPPSVSAAVTSSSHTSRGSGDVMHDSDSPAGRRSVQTLASGSGGGTVAAHTPALTVVSSAGARSARGRGKRGERGALTPVVTASQHKLASPLDRVITVEQRLTRSASADIGMMAAILRDNSERAAEAEQQVSVSGSDDDASVASTSSASSSASSAPPATLSSNAMEQDSPVAPAAVPMSLSIRVRPPEPAPAPAPADAVMPPGGLHIRVGSAALGNMTTESSLNSASSLGTGLSIRGRMPSIRAVAMTTSPDDEEEGLPPEAVGYGSRFAARRSEQMQAVQAAIAAGATLEQLAPPSMRQDSAGEDVASPDATPEVLPSPSLSIRLPSSAPPAAMHRPAAPTPIGSSALPPPPLASVALPALNALPPHMRPPLGSDAGLRGGPGMHYIPPAAMAAIARARGTSGDIPITAMPPAITAPLLPQRSVSSGSSSPVPQLKRVAAIALPSAGSPRALAAGRNSSATSLSSLPAGANRPRVPSSLGAPPPSIASHKGTLAFVAAESLLPPEEDVDDGPQFTFAMPGQLLASGSAGSDASSHVSDEAAEHDASVPGYHLARISSAARRAVEVQQSAMGICEGFQLPAVQLHPTSRKRSRALASAAAGGDGGDMDAELYSDASEAESEYDSGSYSRASSSVFSDEYSTDMDLDDASSVGGASSAHGSECGTPHSVQRDDAGFVPLLRAHKRGRRAGDDLYSPASAHSGGPYSRAHETSPRDGNNSRVHATGTFLHARVVSPASVASGASEASSAAGRSLLAPVAGAAFAAVMRSSSASSAHTEGPNGLSMADLQAVFGDMSISHGFATQAPAPVLPSYTPSASPYVSETGQSISSASQRRRAAPRGSPRSGRSARMASVARSSSSTYSVNASDDAVDVTDRLDRDAGTAGGLGASSDDSFVRSHAVSMPLRIARPAVHYTSDDGSGGSGTATGGQYTSTGLTALSSISGGSTHATTVGQAVHPNAGQREGDAGSDADWTSTGLHSRPHMVDPAVQTLLVEREARSELILRQEDDDESL